MDLNRVTLCGRLCADPELKTTSGGKSYTRVSLATHRRWKAENSEWKTQTEFHPVVAWGEAADRFARQCKKGEAVFVEGSLRHNSWQDAAGVRKFMTEVSIDRWVLLRVPAAAPEKEEALPTVEELAIEEIKVEA